MTLALRYRPKRLEDFRGQQHVVYVVRKMLERWRAGEIELPSGLLLTGAFGCGKTSMARVIATYLNCSPRDGQNPPCGECLHCGAIHEFTSDAVLEIDGATSGLVDDVRQLASAVHLSHSGLYRVVIVDEVHAMSTQAFSALLKQLEEPPSRVLYILVTTEAQAVPATIRSRCLTFEFAPVDKGAVMARLTEIAKAESIEYDDGGIARIATQSRGAMRDALMMLEQAGIAGSARYEFVSTIWPDIYDRFAAEFMASVETGTIAYGREVVREAFSKVRDSNALADAIVDHLADRALEFAGAGNRREAAQWGGLIPHVWDLRVKLRHAPVHDPTLVEALWYVLAKEWGTVQSSAYAPRSADRGVPASSTNVPSAALEDAPQADPFADGPVREAVDMRSSLQEFLSG